jgi:hypothetical protein
MRVRSWPVAILIGSATPAVAQFQSPDSAIKALYASYGLGGDSDKNRFDDKLAAQIFDKTLFSLYRRLIDSGTANSDFFVQGNNFSLAKPIEIDKVSVTGTKAKVSATLTQNLVGAVPVHRFVFVVVKSEAGWQIDDAFCNGKSARDEWNAAIKSAN